MAITASMVKELRERTGSGMMECKRALVETDGDIELAIENMRKSGQAKAAKKAGRTAADGIVDVAYSEDGKTAVIIEVNCETDFVAKDDSFNAFVQAVAVKALTSESLSVDVLLEEPLHEGEETTVKMAQDALIVKIGENMNVRRFQKFNTDSGILVSYRHGVRIGVLVEVEGGDATLAKDVAMHIAATNPLCMSHADVPAETLQKERDIFTAQALESGKPENIVEKMVEGRIRKFLAEISLESQPFVKNPDQTVGQLLSDAGAKLIRYSRLEVGEGIEKKQEDFAAEVMAQVKG